MNNSKTIRITLVGMGIALNIVGAFIALGLKLPIYLDSMGTIFISFILGPIWGSVTGLAGSIISGLTFDIYSLYFAPVQIFTGLLAGYLFSKGFMNGKKIIVSTFLMTILISTVGAIITIEVFGGITSSGSSYILTILRHLGVNPVLSAFIVQFFTDYVDKLIACILMVVVIARMPSSLLSKLSIKDKNNKVNITRDKVGC